LNKYGKMKCLIMSYTRKTSNVVLIILNIFLLFIATELLLVIVNSCLEKHLPHGLLFVIANSTSILHVCLNVIAMILCSA
jgi:hypothetical protein